FEGRRRARVEALPVPAQLPRARGAGHAARRDLPQEGGAPRRDGTGQGAQGMTPPSATTTTSNPTWADVNRDVIRTVSMPGDRYFAWMCLVGLTLAAGVAAWSWQIWI